MSSLLALTVALWLRASEQTARAQALVKARDWEGLYLAFAATAPEALSGPERTAIARALHQGCEARRLDATMAYSLGQRAVAFEDTVPARLCLARAAVATQQRTAAEEALRGGLEQHPHDERLALALAELLFEEQDLRGALEVLQRVRRPRRARAFRALERRIRAQQKAEARAQREAQRASARPATAPSGGSLTYESGVGPGGVRTRSNRRFHFKYFGGDRDFGQRAEYEGRVAGALDVAYEEAREHLGAARDSAVDVVLYSKEEFALHHGPAMAMRIAGLYSGGAIRINDAAEVNAENTATLVHEYVHAVVDELAQGRSDRVPVWLNEGLAEYVEWRHLGGDGPPLAMAVALRGAAKANTLPSLTTDADRAFVRHPDAQLRYAHAGAAVKLLRAKVGMDGLRRLVTEVAQGASFEQVFAERVGKPLTTFEAELREALQRR